MKIIKIFDISLEHKKLSITIMKHFKTDEFWVYLSISMGSQSRLHQVFQNRMKFSEYVDHINR
jgi:hypothetical protein